MNTADGAPINKQRSHNLFSNEIVVMNEFQNVLHRSIWNLDEMLKRNKIYTT